MKNKGTLFLIVGLLAFLTAAFALINSYSKTHDARLGAHYQRREAAKDFDLAVIGKSQYLPTADVMDFDSLRRKPVLLHFWASWCTVCREEKPSLDAFWSTHKDSDIVVIGVASFDTKKAMGDSELIKIPTYTVVLDQEGDVANAYKVSALPSSFLVDTEGFIVQKFMGPLQPYDYTAIENYLDSLKSSKAH